MTETVGYVDIFFQALGILSLLGSLLLFFIERPTYGRSSLGQESWRTVLLYNILTAGAYGIYWRLKSSYALSPRDRLAAWQWILLLGIVFAIFRPLRDLWLLTTIWDCVILVKLQKTLRRNFSILGTVIFGHYYLASILERNTDVLPLDFRWARPERRRRIVLVYSLAASVITGLAGLGYGQLVDHRRKEFAQIAAEGIDRSGYWHEEDEFYDRVYAVDSQGVRQVAERFKHPHGSRAAEHISYTLNSKIRGNTVYTWNWFSCLRADQLVEIKKDQLVVRDEFHTRIENRVDGETYEDLKRSIQSADPSDWGWELGELLKSPWDCEIQVMRKAWAKG